MYLSKKKKSILLKISFNFYFTSKNIEKLYYNPSRNQLGETISRAEEEEEGEE